MQSTPTIDAYNKFAQVYDEEVIEFWKHFPKEFLNQFSKNLPGKRVLNVGSGSGRDALLLRSMGLEVVCIDGPQSMVDITTRLGFESYLADFSEIDFPNASFDGIWAYTSLIHVSKESAQQIIQMLHGLVKSQGIFAIGVIEGTTANMVERKTMPGAVRYFKNYTNQELRELVEPLGFTFMYEHNFQPHNSVYVNQIYRTI